MTTFQIKLLAILFMTIDHIGYVFFPQLIILRILGRLSFPLLAWLIANGARHTHNIHQYLLRLFFVAVLSEIPYILLNRQIDSTFWNLNALFTLSLGLLAIELIQVTKDKRIGFLLACLCAFVGQIFVVDYGALGVLLSIFFYLFFTDFKKMMFSYVLLLTVGFCLTVIFPFLEHNALNTVDIVEPFGVFALIFIWLYNNREGLKIQYLFYIFYPVHLLVLFLLQVSLP